MNKKLLTRYAHLILIKGVNIQKNQDLYINIPIQANYFLEILVKEAYKLGCRYCFVQYYNNHLDDLRVQYSTKEGLNYYPKYLVTEKINMAQERVAILNFKPHIIHKSMNNNQHHKTIQEAFNKANFDYLKVKRNKNFNSCSSVIPSVEWAKYIYPELSAKKSLNSLWNDLFTITNCHKDNYLDLFEEHLKNIETRRDKLNSMKIKKLWVKDQLNDFSVELPKNHVWIGGLEYTKDGIKSMPNFPTEEIFTVPNYLKVNGVIHNSRPLVYQNKIIDQFYLKVKDGKVINYRAMQGHEVLKELLESDTGSSYFGEFALVEKDSLVSRVNKIFYHTLLDENACCHMALGCAYPVNLEPRPKSYDQTCFNKCNINFSKIHCDFMFGYPDTTITAIDQNNKEVVIMKQGKWKI